MLTNAAYLKDMVIRATDGDIGTVDQFYFDDQAWAIRYLTVETGGWLGDREVLISPISIVHADWQAWRLEVALTKLQVKNSPGIDTHQPVSRQHEATYLDYYGYSYYWIGPNMWGPVLYPSGLPIPASIIKDGAVEPQPRESPRIHICAVTKPSRVITLRQMMVRSATWKGSSWTMKPGLSAILR